MCVRERETEREGEREREGGGGGDREERGEEGETFHTLFILLMATALTAF